MDTFRLVMTLALVLAIFDAAPARAAGATPVGLARTGQTLCYDAAGAPVACAGTGQDGEIRAGIPWPVPRFTAHPDGTVTDNLTGLIWLKDADCADLQPGTTDWGSALTAVNALHSGQCGLTDGSHAGDWRMPNTTELESLIDLSQYAPPLPLGHPFLNVVYGYWTSTTLAAYPGNAEWIPMDNGCLRGQVKTKPATLWPVRGTSTMLARTGLNTCWNVSGASIPCAGTGQDGDKLSGVAWPTPRFVDTGIGTQADRLTGLVWLKNTDCFGNTSSQSAAIGHVKTLASGACGLTDGSVPGDWRLPNRRELRSLLNYSATDGGVWLDSQGFVNAHNAYYWSSDSYPNYIDLAWFPAGGDPNLGDKWMVRSLGGTLLSSWVFAIIPAEDLHTLPVRDRLKPILTWPAPAAIVAGTPLSATQLRAAASVPGGFVYSPAAGTVLGTGAGQMLSVSFTPVDQDNYTTATASVTLDVTAPPPPPVLLGDLNGDGKVDVADALLALHFAVSGAVPTVDQLARGDVGPLVNGAPAHDGKIDISDALLILEKVVGLLTW